MRRIVLAGNPNVGKSVIFTQISGVYAFSSNYPGTTVDFLRSYVEHGGEWYEVIDAPGTYSLEGMAEAERIAARLVEEADIVVNVVDAGNLERNLYLTFELAERQKPMVVALNMWDEAKKRGIDIDLKALEGILGVPVVPVVATTGEGIKNLLAALQEARVPSFVSPDHTRRWEEIGRVISEVQRFSYRRPTWRDTLQRVTLLPGVGLVFGFVALLGIVFSVRFIGEGLIHLLDPLFERYYLPLLERLGILLSRYPFWYEVLIGKPVDGHIDFELSLGLLSTGVYVSLGAVLPYVLAFYLVLGLLEDVGYLPRLAVLLDGFLHRLGLHGYSVVPMLLGLGCNVPGIMATRVLESEKERFVVTVLIAIGIPCSAQQALIVGALAPHGVAPLLVVYGTLFAVVVSLALLLKYLVPGFRPPLICEIPPYRLPFPKAVLSKLWVRLRGFLRDALPIVFLGTLIVNLLYLTNAFPVLARFVSPWLSRVLGLPPEAILVIALGVLRKYMAMGLLLPLGLSVKQLIIASVVISLFFPCVAAFVVVLREFGWKRLLEAIAIMLSFAFFVGSILNVLL
ncbi:FeoB small GTPase domain-containing protein [Candidatus Caldatribacterium sp. SIUC1]|uniref:FeoB small GTPase domain-containing protein n=1 Tax=Candidatus Caldatribacterium sp. SIUC1 TaxID=3418365 RepID=UPI003F6949AB